MPEQVVHCKRDDYDVYIGSPSKWGNPFTIGKDGTREEVIEKYRLWLLAPAQHVLASQLWELDGKVLGCWCAPQACHGHVLVELLEEVRQRAERHHADTRSRQRHQGGQREELHR